MRFTAAATVLFAGAVMAGQPGQAGTTTVTDVETITSCGPTVTDCPARQHSSTEAWAETTATSSPESSAWTGPASESSTESWTAPASPASTESSTWTASGTWSPSGTWVSSVTQVSPTGASSSGIWDDCDCDEYDSCATGSATGTGSWGSSPTGGSTNGSVQTSSPTGVIPTAGAGVAAPAFLAIAAGIVAFLA